MIKDDLIYDWKHAETHLGYRLLAVIVVAGVFVLCGSLIDVKIGENKGGVTQTATVLRFMDDDLGRFWQLKAEEEGPFPGGLQSPEPVLDLVTESVENENWNTYEITPVPFTSKTGVQKLKIASKGTRFFPEHAVEKKEQIDDQMGPVLREESVKFPVLISTDKEGVDAIPDTLPEFGLLTAGMEVHSASWRFLVSLRADGSVESCISLGGEHDEALEAVLGWLRGVKFNEGGEDRWLGIRMKFVEGEVK